ncbi:MAG: hypothetical protein II576_05765 [Prevotella sp.]|nr:hypothetical protein [Prevotella sp.]
MGRIIGIISVVLTLTVLASCTDKEAMRQRLDYVSQCNRADTVFTEAWLPTVDSLVNYFDRHGNANEKMMVHYLKGRVHHDMGESPIALECYQRATEMADTTQKGCDLHTLAAIYGQMANLFHMQYLPDDEMKALKMVEHYAMKNNDTLTAITAYRLRTGVYFLLNDTDSMLSVTKRSVSLYRKYGRNDLAAQILIMPISVSLDRGQYKEAWKYMQVYEKESGFLDSNGNARQGKGLYYYYKGLYLLSQNQLDKAISLFHKVLSGGFLEAGYKGLLIAYEQKYIPDSIAKYARLFADANDSSYLNVNQERVRQVSAMYNYNRSQRLADKKTIEAERYKNIIYIIIGVGVFSVIVLFRIWRLYERNNRNKILIWNKKYYDTLTQYQNVRNDLMLSFKNFEQYRTGKEKEVEELRQSLSVFLEDKTNPEVWNLELFVSSSSIVKRMHELAYKAKQPSEVEWDDLRQLLCKHLPSFYKLIKDDKYGLSNHEQKVAMLIRLRFIPTELIALLNISKQRVTNIRSDINHKLFHEKGTKDLDANLMRIK